MARWLSVRRCEAAEGTLDPAYSAGLAWIPGWLENCRESADENRLHQNLARLVAYREEGNDWPRHHYSGSEREHSLGVWIHAQRYKHRRGELGPVRLKLLVGDPAVRASRCREPGGHRILAPSGPPGILDVGAADGHAAPQPALHHPGRIRYLRSVGPWDLFTTVPAWQALTPTRLAAEESEGPGHRDGRMHDHLANLEQHNGTACLKLMAIAPTRVHHKAQDDLAHGST